MDVGVDVVNSETGNRRQETGNRETETEIGGREVWSLRIVFRFSICELASSFEPRVALVMSF